MIRNLKEKRGEVITVVYKGVRCFQPNSWLGLGVLNAIECKIGSEHAVVILNLIFGRPKETTQSRGNEQSGVEENGTTDPGIIMFSHHVRFCIACIVASVSSFPGEVIGSNVKSIKSALLALDTKGELEVCRLM